MCHETENLHVHHHTYVRLGIERLTDLVGLCADHHIEVHDFARKHKPRLLVEYGERWLTGATAEVTGLELSFS